MIVQAIALLDDLDKELNTYAMRVREWYGWHFPEMTKIVSDNIQYAKTVRASSIASTLLLPEPEPVYKDHSSLFTLTVLHPQAESSIMLHGIPCSIANADCPEYCSDNCCRLAGHV